MSNNGLISFSSSLPSPSFNPMSLPLAGYPFVAPFWADIDTRRSSGTVWWRETNSSTVLNRAREDIQTAFETSVGFQPQFAFIATWERVEYFSGPSGLVNIDNDIMHRASDTVTAILLFIMYSCMGQAICSVLPCILESLSTPHVANSCRYLRNGRSAL